MYNSDECIDEDVKYLENEPERVGYPTQKPVGLYARMIRSSSNPGDMVLDPFCGCATTLVAAEKLKREWIGIDIWAKAHETVIKRLKNDGYLAGPDGRNDSILITEGRITYTTNPPRRNDDGNVAAPPLKIIRSIHEPPGPKMSRVQMYEYLLDQKGRMCQGCDRKFDDKRYLDLDHNTPRSDGGLNHLSNRILLCGPCNTLKSNTLTLSGLRRENKKRGHMVPAKQSPSSSG